MSLGASHHRGVVMLLGAVEACLARVPVVLGRTPCRISARSSTTIANEDVMSRKVQGARLPLEESVVSAPGRTEPV